MGFSIVQVVAIVVYLSSIDHVVTVMYVLGLNLCVLVLIFRDK